MIKFFSKHRNEMKRLAVILFVVMVAYFNINMHMNYDINRDIEKAQREGEITSLTQLDRGMLRENNRAQLYVAAGELVNLDKSYWRNEIVESYKDNKSKALADISANKPALDLMNQVETKTDCNFELHYKDGFDMRVPNFLHLRNLAFLLSMDAMADIDNKNYDEAVKRCTQCINLGRDLAVEKTIIQQMMSVAIIRIGAAPLEYMLQEGIKADYGPAISELQLIKAAGHENFIKSLEGERTTGVDLFNKILGTGYSESVDPFGSDGLFSSLKDNTFIMGIAYTLGYSVDDFKKAGPPVFLRRAAVAIAKPYILANERYYVRYMNKMIDEIQAHPENGLVYENVNDWYPIGGMLIPNLSKALKNQNEMLTKCSNLITGLAGI